MANERTLKLKIRELEKVLAARKSQVDLLARMANEALRVAPPAAQRELVARWQKGEGRVAVEVKLELQREIGRLSSLTDARELLARAATLLAVLPLGSSVTADALVTEIDAFTGRPTARTIDATAALEHGQHRCDPEKCPICGAFPNAKRRRLAEEKGKLRAVEDPERPRGAAERGEAFAKSGDVADLVAGLEEKPAPRLVTETVVETDATRALDSALRSGPLLERLAAAGGEVHDFPATPAEIVGDVAQRAIDEQAPTESSPEFNAAADAHAEKQFAELGRDLAHDAKLEAQLEKAERDALDPEAAS